MFKRKYLLTFLLLSLFVLVSCGYEKETIAIDTKETIAIDTKKTTTIDLKENITLGEFTNWKDYENIDLGFSFKYPGDWKLETETKDSLWYWASILSPGYVSGVGGHGGALMINDVLIKVKETLEKPKQCFEERELANNLKKYKVCILYNEPREHDVEFDIYYVYDGNNVKLEYLIQSYLEDDKKVQYYNTLKDIIKTIK